MVDRTKHQNAPDWHISAKREKSSVSPSDIFRLTVGVAANIIGEGVVCGFNLFWWVVLSSDFQGI